jgi:predicted ATPase with chaperone activity
MYASQPRFRRLQAGRPGGFDQTIALWLPLGSGQVSFHRPDTYSIVGELALTGETRPIKRVLKLMGWNLKPQWLRSGVSSD